MKDPAYLVYFVAGLFLLFGTIYTISHTDGFTNEIHPWSSLKVSFGSVLLSAIWKGNQIVYEGDSINISGMNDVASNTTIIGLGKKTRITNVGFDINDDTNGIVDNNTFKASNKDAINVKEVSSHVWGDSYSLASYADGQVDIKWESDCISFSWSLSNRDNDHCFLLGHCNNHTFDKGNLRNKYNHNYFEGDGRKPGVMVLALTHVFNNYYNDCEYKNPLTISLLHSQDGEGEFDWQTTGEISYINFRNLEKLKGSGVDFSTIWSGSMPPKQDGYYNIPYIWNYDWLHFEAVFALNRRDLTDKNSTIDVHNCHNPAGCQLNKELSRKLLESIDFYLMNSTGKVVLSAKQIDGTANCICPDSLWDYTC